MPILEIRFPSGHFHATPSWGHHVNEGLIEWPPSPWRLLRALIATGYNKRHWPDQIPPPVAISLIYKLASVLPSYALPAASGSHTRHYMPQGEIVGRPKKSPAYFEENTALVFDAFAHSIVDAMLVHWAVDLTVDERDLLADLAAHLSYLGRAESWTDARLLPDDSALIRSDCTACEPDSFNKRGFEQVSLLASVTNMEFEHWLANAVDDAKRTAGVVSAPVTAEGTPRSKQQIKAAEKAAKLENDSLNKAIAPFPKSLIEALQSDTTFWRKHGWSQPPGARKVLYWRPTHGIQVAPAVLPRPNTDARAPVQAMLIALASSTNNQNALPNRKFTLIECEKIHGGLAQKMEELSISSSTLSGTDDDGRPLLGEHKHAYVCGLDLDEDENIDHFLIFAKAGLTSSEQRVVSALRKIYAKGQAARRVAAAASGELKVLAQNIPELQRYVGPSRHWLSTTPFVPPRYLKQNGKNSLEAQIKSELAARELPTEVAIRVIKVNSDSPYADEARKQRHFKRTRDKLAPKQDVAFTLELLFEQSVSGPIALGYASHFGLGLFVALHDPKSSSEEPIQALQTPSLLPTFDSDMRVPLEQLRDIAADEESLRGLAHVAPSKP